MDKYNFCFDFPTSDAFIYVDFFLFRLCLTQWERLRPEHIYTGRTDGEKKIVMAVELAK